MGRVNETVRTVNSAFRTALLTVALVAAGIVGWKGYSFYNEPQQQLAEERRKLADATEELESAQRDLAAREQKIGELTADVEAKNEEIAKLETSIRLLKLRHRIARIRVIDQRPQKEGSEEVITTVEFVEVNDEGAPIDARPRKLEIAGDRIYVECLVAKFDDQYVEQADLDRGTAICLIQRVFGEHQQPHEGYEIDPQGTSPTSYARGGKSSEFEQQIWRDFWTLANDPAKAKALGIRAAHANAPSIKMRSGATYELELRATGEFSLKRVAEN